MSIADIAAQVRGYKASHVVLTGGEPMLFADSVALTQMVKTAGTHITVETAGTVYQPVVADLMSISPKLASSTPLERDGGRWAVQHEKLRYQPDVLRRLTSDYEYQLKFVVTQPDDMAEILKMVDELRADPKRVVLMPEGTSAQAIASRAAWIAELCTRHGFRYSPRLHVDIWGNERGR